MTRQLLSLIAALLAWTAAAAVAAATLDEIKQRGYIVVATETDCPPFEYAVNGGRAGFDHDLLVAFTQSTGLEIRQELVPWKDILPGVASGKYDVAASAVFVTPGRAKIVDFTMPIAESSMAYLTRKGDRATTGVKGLSGVTLGVQQGGISADTLPVLKAELRKSGGKLGKVVQYPEYAPAYADLLKRNIGAIVNNRDSLAQLAAGTSGLFEVGPSIGPRLPIAWAVQKGNRSLRDFLNAHLAEQKANGTLAQLHAKYKLTLADLPN